MEGDVFRRSAAEFVGAFALTFIGAGAIMTGSGLVGVAFAHGLVIAVMASAVGHISGGHFNPAVTFGFLITRRMAPMLAGAYWVSQFAGAVLAVFRADVPYVPTRKQGSRSTFLPIAWPPLVVCGTFVVTLVHVVRVRMGGGSEPALELSSEAVWGMLAFAAVPVAAAVATLFAAWQARHVPTGAAWDDVDVERIGGHP